MQHKHLVKAQKYLKHYFTYFKDDNILVVAEDKNSLPFAYVIIEDQNYPNIFLLSLDVSYLQMVKAINFTLLLNKIKEVKLVDGFFIAQTGITYIGDDAEKYRQLEFEIPLQEIDPESDTLH
jgi:hypothetical protein